MIARKILGNMSVIQHEVTGFLFDSPEECRQYGELILKKDSADMVSKIRQNGKKLIEEKYNQETEKRSYQNLVLMKKS